MNIDEALKQVEELQENIVQSHKLKKDIMSALTFVDDNFKCVPHVSFKMIISMELVNSHVIDNKQFDYILYARSESGDIEIGTHKTSLITNSEQAQKAFNKLFTSMQVNH